MSALDRVLPTPRLVEVDSVDLALTPEEAWNLVRHVDLGRVPAIRALFRVRTLGEPSLRLDDVRSTPQNPGFGILVDDAPREVVVAAIGKVYQLDIPFVHVGSVDAYHAFREPGYVKVAWAIQVAPYGARDARVTVEVRVDATDDASWKKFRRYFALIGPGSHFIRRALLASFVREHGTPASKENERPLLGDELLPDAAARATDAITIEAPPEAIWPWLVQMGCRRAGFYSIDTLDNGGKRSAREIHPELQSLAVGEIIPATPFGNDGFEVLRIEPGRALVFGGLYDAARKRQLPFGASRPEAFWHVTWSFVLEPLDARTTRLHARARVAFPASEKMHAAWIRPVHHLMETAQLRHLAARAEGRLARDDWRDVAEGAAGAAIMIAAFLTPFLRAARSHWGLDVATAERIYPGDELVPEPRWSWTHGIAIDAPAREVWPWIAQVGAAKGGFYSYQLLENLAGCELRNAEVVHPEWAAREGGELRLHPKMPPLHIVSLVEGHHLVAHAPADAAARSSGRRWADVTWLFYVEPLGEGRCRLVSRYRCACSDDLATRLSLGPTLLEPIGFAMDRRMLLGVKERAEHHA